MSNQQTTTHPTTVEFSARVGRVITRLELQYDTEQKEHKGIRQN